MNQHAAPIAPAPKPEAAEPSAGQGHPADPAIGRGGPSKPPRDLRLDFFRGIAMFIILLAHTPGNSWTLWIPARFGFSDATEIFVFCSGMASALAFGTVYLQRSYFLGSARIAYRVWQVYWAHVGVFLVTALMLLLIERSGIGAGPASARWADLVYWLLGGKDYANWASISRLWSDTQDTLLGLFTLTYVPGLFDILPMYLVILAMVPLVMLAYKAGGRWAVFALVIGVWAAAQMAGYARIIDTGVTPRDLKLDRSSVESLLIWLKTVWPDAMAGVGGIWSDVQARMAETGAALSWMNFRGSPFSETFVWFFNPFGWQLVFFTGFAFGMGWLPAPPVRRWLVVAALAFLVLSLPLAWHKMYQYFTGILRARARRLAGLGDPLLARAALVEVLAGRVPLPAFPGARLSVLGRCGPGRCAAAGGLGVRPAPARLDRLGRAGGCGPDDPLGADRAGEGDLARGGPVLPREFRGPWTLYRAVPAGSSGRNHRRALGRDGRECPAMDAP